MARLDLYAALLARWQPRINLVGPKTMPDLWTRHFLDSAQLLPLISGVTRLVDLGSGGGFPGLVLAILTGAETHLVESDQRKAIFLREVARETGAPVTVHAGRAEQLGPLAGGLVTARALAPLAELLPLAYRHMQPAGRMVFLKGSDWQVEVDAARTAGWTFHVERRPSLTAPDAAILELADLRPPA